jgi:trehalose-6-phosphate synthase
MAKWMNITIFGLNVVITWQPKTYRHIGTEFSEQQLNSIGIDLDEKVTQLRKRLARLQREIGYFGVEASRESRGSSQKVQSSSDFRRSYEEHRLPTKTETPTSNAKHEAIKAKLKDRKK